MISDWTCLTIPWASGLVCWFSILYEAIKIVKLQTICSVINLNSQWLIPCKITSHMKGLECLMSQSEGFYLQILVSLRISGQNIPMHLAILVLFNYTFLYTQETWKPHLALSSKFELKVTLRTLSITIIGIIFVPQHYIIEFSSNIRLNCKALCTCTTKS